MQDLDSLVCPACCAEGKDNFVKFGFVRLYQKRVQRFQCKLCGRVFHI